MLPGVGETAIDAAGREPLFFEIRTLTLGSIMASMVAYLAAQLCDVHLFQFWRNLTRGRHLWLRNNASTFVSQFVDTFAVITITHFYAGALPIESELPLWPQLWVLHLDRLHFQGPGGSRRYTPFYWLTHRLSRYCKSTPSPNFGKGRPELHGNRSTNRGVLVTRIVEVEEGSAAADLREP